MTSSSSPLRVVLDVNIWLANLLAASKGRQGTAVQQIITMVSSGKWHARDVQLVASHEMLETLEMVLMRRGAASDSTEAYVSAVTDIMRFGPEQLDPYLLLGDGREQFAISDVEDAGILATAFAARASLIITDNLRDFESKDASRIDTQIVHPASGPRQLFALRYRQSNLDLIVAHPLDVIDWLERRLDIEPDAIWRKITL